MDFKILSKAMRFEKVVGEILSLTYNISPLVTNRDSKFDYQTSNEVKIEVKYNNYFEIKILYNNVS